MTPAAKAQMRHTGRSARGRRKYSTAANTPSTGSAMRPVFPYASASREKQTPKTKADRALPSRTTPTSAQKTHGKTANETTTTKCSKPTARVSTEGFSKNNTAPSHAANPPAFQRRRKKYIPAAPATRQRPTATFEPARKPKGKAVASMTTLENM